MSKMGRYKSYLTGVQGHFWIMSKRKTLFFMASLRHSSYVEIDSKLLQIETVGAKELKL